MPVAAALTPPVAARPAQSWSARLAPFRQPDLVRSVWQLLNSAMLFVAGWALTYASLRLVLLAHAAAGASRPPSCWSGCSSSSTTADTARSSSRRARPTSWAVLGVLTLTPYSYWKPTHAMHHATSGNLDHRGFGDINTLTVREYLAKPRGSDCSTGCIGIR